MRGLIFFRKLCYREIRAMRGHVMRGLPVSTKEFLDIIGTNKKLVFNVPQSWLVGPRATPSDPPAPP